MDKLSMAIIAMEAHIACSNERLRQAWEIIHAKLVEENGSSHNTGSPKCEQCIHWNVEHGHHETECYSCKRYHVDMFTQRAGA